MRLFFLLLFTLPLFATNGDNLVGAGAQSRALAGSGGALFLDGESIFLNPALISKAKKTTLDAGLTLFYPKVHAKRSTWQKSEADFEAIPYLAALFPLSSTQTLGIGLFSVSGMGVKYHANELANMRTRLRYAKLAIAYTKKFDNLSLGIAAHLAYGDLLLRTSGMNGDKSGDIGTSLQLGASYDFAPFIFSLTYLFPTPMRYDNLYDFNGDGKRDSLSLTQPAEAAFALAYNLKSTILTAEIKRIFWADAKGYKDFEWKSQNVVAIGLKTKLSQNLSASLGASFATSPLKTFSNAQSAFFNIVGFPAISKRHYTFGFSYHLFNATLHAAYIHAPKELISSHGFSATNTQNSLTLGVTYAF